MGAEPGGLDDLPVAALTLRDGLVTSANPAASELLGVRVGGPFVDTLPETVRSEVAAWLAAGTAEPLIVRLRSGKDFLAVELRASGPVIVALDVTEYRRLAAVFDAVSDSASLLDENGVPFWHSAGALRDYARWNLTPGVANLMEWTHPDDIPSMLELFGAALEGRVTRATYVTRWRAPDQPENEWHRSRQVGVVAFDNPDLGGIVHMHIDRETVDFEELAGSDEWRMLSLAEAVPLGILIGTHDGSVAFSNTFASEMLGAIDRGPGAWVRVARAEFHEPLARIWQDALAGQRGRCVVAVERPTGEELWIQVTAVPQCNAAGNPVGAIATCEDITESVDNLAELKTAEEKLRQLATHDALTGLPNRLLLRERLHELLHGPDTDPSTIGLLFCDLDHFKQVNDEAGHEAGDLVLKVVAARLQSVTRTHDMVARIGGDEFVVVCERVDTGEGLEFVADRIVAAIAEPVDLGRGRSVRIGVSIGLARADATSEPDALVDTADRQMYGTKKQRKLRDRRAG